MRKGEWVRDHDRSVLVRLPNPEDLVRQATGLAQWHYEVFQKSAEAVIAIYL